MFLVSVIKMISSSSFDSDTPRERTITCIQSFHIHNLTKIDGKSTMRKYLLGQISCVGFLKSLTSETKRQGLT